MEVRPYIPYVSICLVIFCGKIPKKIGLKNRPSIILYMVGQEMAIDHILVNKISLISHHICWPGSAWKFMTCSDRLMNIKMCEAGDRKKTSGCVGKEGTWNTHGVLKQTMQQKHTTSKYKQMRSCRFSFADFRFSKDFKKGHDIAWLMSPNSWDIETKPW